MIQRWGVADEHVEFADNVSPAPPHYLRSMPRSSSTPPTGAIRQPGCNSLRNRGRRIEVDGIPTLYSKLIGIESSFPRCDGDIVKGFYEDTRFRITTVSDSRARAFAPAKASFESALLERTASKRFCSEAGCGTGQLEQLPGMLGSETSSASATSAHLSQVLGHGLRGSIRIERRSSDEPVRPRRR